MSMSVSVALRPRPSQCPRLPWSCQGPLRGDGTKSIGDDVNNQRFVELVGELALSSERFRTLWARHDARRLEGGSTTVNHPIVLASLNQAPRTPARDGSPTAELGSHLERRSDR